MPDIPMGWATLIAASVTALGSVAAVVVTIILSARTRRDVKQVATDAREVKEQVKNSHTTNFREEADERHAENARKLDTVLAQNTQIIATQEQHTRDIGFLQRSQRGMRKDISRLMDADQEQTRSDHRLGERITELEKTGPRRALLNGDTE